MRSGGGGAAHEGPREHQKDFCLFLGGMSHKRVLRVESHASSHLLRNTDSFVDNGLREGGEEARF